MNERFLNAFRPQNFHIGPFALSAKNIPWKKTEYRRFNPETEKAIDDVLQGHNLRGPFHCVEELFQDLDAEA